MKYLSILLSTVILFSCGGGGSNSDNTPPPTSGLTKQEWRGTWKYISDDEDTPELYIEITENSLTMFMYSSEYECLDESAPESNASFTSNSIIAFDDDLQKIIEIFVAIENNTLTLTNSDYNSKASYQKADFSHHTLCSENAEEGLIRFEIEFANLPSAVPINPSSNVNIEINIDVDNSSSRTDGDFEIELDFGWLETNDEITNKDLTDLTAILYSCFDITCYSMLEEPLIDIDLENNIITILVDKSAHYAFNEISETTQFSVSAWHSYNDDEETYNYNYDSFEYSSIIDAYNATDPLNDYSGNLDTFDIIGVSAFIDHAEATTQDQ